MLHNIKHPQGLRATRPCYNFASEVLKAGKLDLVLVVEHPDEAGLNLCSTSLVMPELARCYPELDLDVVQVLWASRFGAGRSARLELSTFDQDTGYTGTVPRSGSYLKLKFGSILRDAAGARAPLHRFVRRCEAELEQRFPYAG